MCNGVNIAKLECFDHVRLIIGCQSKTDVYYIWKMLQYGHYIVNRVVATYWTIRHKLITQPYAKCVHQSTLRWRFTLTNHGLCSVLLEYWPRAVGNGNNVNCTSYIREKRAGQGKWECLVQGMARGLKRNWDKGPRGLGWIRLIRGNSVVGVESSVGVTEGRGGGLYKYNKGECLEVEVMVLIDILCLPPPNWWVDLIIKWHWTCNY